MEKPIVNTELLLLKYPGKGGWTYAEIPHLLQERTKPFGWLQVKGTIDNYALKGFNLAPAKGGGLFLPVKSEIRKAIGKEAGDYVKVVLYEDHSVFEVPHEIIDCLKLDERAYQKFMKLKPRCQKEYISWIYEAKKDETRANRINKMMAMVLEGKNLYDPPE